MSASRPAPAVLFLFWCLAGGVAVSLFLAGPIEPWPPSYSPIFWYLLKAFDPVANALLLVFAPLAFALRRRPGIQAAVQAVGARPWAVAGAAFVMLCLGSIFVYRDLPLSMDEYSGLFQARVFAAGKLAGAFPPDLLDRLIPAGFQNVFLSVSRATGEVSTTYWPGFSLLLAPFAWLGIPWAANPAIGALAIPVVHRLTAQVTGSREAAAWAVLFMIASPVFIVNSISYYAMPAHLLLNATYALLLLRPTMPRAVAAGLVGSLALMLHNPFPHLLFALPFVVWLLARRGSLGILACLLVTYGAFGVAAGLAWKLYLAGMAGGAPAGAAASAGAATNLVLDLLAVFTLPSVAVLGMRIAGLTKLWTWGAMGIVVLAAWGFWFKRRDTSVRLLAGALAATLLGYLAVPFDQGHGWGYRYVYPAWFVLPVLAAAMLTALPRDADEASAVQLRDMAAWGILFSLVLANGLRLDQVAGFVDRHWQQVPPLARRPGADPEIVFVDPGAGFYAFDLIQNDPFLRGTRIVLLGRGSEPLDAFMAGRFPGYRKVASGPWGERWIAPPMR